jgi:hypothetical protein
VRQFRRYPINAKRRVQVGATRAITPTTWRNQQAIRQSHRHVARNSAKENRNLQFANEELALSRSRQPVDAREWRVVTALPNNHKMVTAASLRPLPSREGAQARNLQWDWRIDNLLDRIF